MGRVNKTASAIAYCDVHRKLLYTDRKRARSVARQHPEHKNVYPCSVNVELYHIGRLPDEIRHGHMTKDEYYGEHVS